MATVFEALSRAARDQERVALGVICGTKGSSPQKLGAKAVFHADGRITGTLGGGCLEAEVQRRAVASLTTGKPERFDLVLDHDFGWDDGLICGGKVFGLILPGAESAGEPFWQKLAARTHACWWGIRPDYMVSLADAGQGSAAEVPGSWLYCEEVTPPCALWIAGAGHIAQAVAPWAQTLDFDVTVLDDRPGLASPAFFPPGVRLLSDHWEELLKTPLPEAPSFGLVVTRGHRHDALVLRDWVRKPFRFIGMIGSARKARIVFDHFRGEHLASDAELARVACPVGLSIRSRTVPEIAVSILAQFVEKRAEVVGEARVQGSTW